MARVTGESQAVLGLLRSANMNSTADQAIPIAASKYVVRRIVVTNTSLSLTLAVGGVYTGAGKTGTTVVANTQLFSALSGATKVLDATVIALTDVLTASSLFLSLTTAQGSAATADIYVIGDVLE